MNATALNGGIEHFKVYSSIQIASLGRSNIGSTIMTLLLGELL
jgi:hypothetical protein